MNYFIIIIIIIIVIILFLFCRKSENFSHVNECRRNICSGKKIINGLCFETKEEC